MLFANIEMFIAINKFVSDLFIAINKFYKMFLFIWEALQAVPEGCSIGKHNRRIQLMLKQFRDDVRPLHNPLDKPLDILREERRDNNGH